MSNLSPEGVVKYHCRLEQRPLDSALLPTIHQLNQWRAILVAHNLIGEDLERYGGGFGNISQRLDSTNGIFIVTATQTGRLDSLGLEHFAVVTGYDFDNNELEAYGLSPPSSEALTHAALYEADPTIEAVFHAHSPVIWSLAVQLGIPTTLPNIGYGTPELALEMRRLIQVPGVKEKGIIAMLGHEDGIVTFGNDKDEAGERMLECLTEATTLAEQATDRFSSVDTPDCFSN